MVSPLFKDFLFLLISSGNETVCLSVCPSSLKRLSRSSKWADIETIFSFRYLSTPLFTRKFLLSLRVHGPYGIHRCQLLVAKGDLPMWPEMRSRPPNQNGEAWRRVRETCPRLLSFSSWLRELEGIKINEGKQEKATFLITAAFLLLVWRKQLGSEICGESKPLPVSVPPRKNKG